MMQRSGDSTIAACDCCQGTERITPQPTANRPGLPALRYRVGTHASFLETMKARLSSLCLGSEDECRTGQGRYPLEALRTRDASDPAIAMLDAWAVVADVLTHYQERIANEGYLRSATERRSVLELARLVGYRLRPGVAASVFLAYTIDENTREEVVIPKGARAQSVPGPDELPESFETSDDLPARAAWNNLKPRQTQPQTWETVTQARSPSRVYLKGVATNLRPGDPLLIRREQMDPELFRVVKAEAQPEADRTKVEIRPWVGTASLSRPLESARELVRRLSAAAPRGVMAGEVVEHLDAVRAMAARVQSPQELAVFLQRETLPLVARLRREAEAMHAPRLAPWLAETEDAVAALIPELEQQTGARAVAGRATGSDDATRLTLLTKPPAPSRPNGLRLPRSLAESFTPSSDAGFKVLGALRPELRTTLPLAWSQYAGASPPPSLKVHALRLKAGLFGHGVPKRQRVVRTRVSDGDDDQATEVQPIGEWPIVLGVQRGGEGEEPTVVATESPGTIFLDASYEGILPESWLVLDFGGVGGDLQRQVTPTPFPESEGGPERVAEPRRNILVVRAETVQAKVSRAEYGSSGDSTRVTLDRSWIRIAPRANPSRAPQGEIDHDFQVIRGTAVYAQSEELALAEEPIESPVCGGGADELIELDRLYSDLEPGRFVVVSGERTDIPVTTGVPASELAMLVEVLHDVRRADGPGPRGETDSALPGDRNHTYLRLDKPLAYCYRRDTVKIYGNVVKATHGETRNEVLGSGDGATPLQSFALKQPPVTFVAAATLAGAESSLQIFVNDVRWREVETLVERPATAHIFITETDDDDRTTVTFGDGESGARLPTGVANVKAVYRRGLGRGGNVRAGQISLLSTRPLGVKEVINPLRASGGADKEGRDQARRNAPLAVKALDRLVSTLDYEDFARTFAGIGKTRATEATDGVRAIVHVTIAGADDIPIDETSDLFLNLRRALGDFGDPLQSVRLAVRELLLLVISARLRILPDYQWEPVVTAVRAALLEAFGFERRELGQDVVRSEVIRTIQAVRGVAYVDLDALGAIPETTPVPGPAGGRRLLTPDEIAGEVAAIVTREIDNKTSLHRIAVGFAEFSGSDIRPAQLALLTPHAPATLILNQIQ